MACLSGLVWPTRPDLATALARFDASRLARPEPSPAAVGGWLAVGQTRVGSWLLAALAAHGIRLGTRTADLELLGRSPERFAGRKALTGLYGALLAPAAAAAWTAAGARLPAVPPLLATPVLAPAFWPLPDIDLRRSAAARRREFRRAFGCYLDLVAMSLAGGRAVPEALPTAAAVGHGWAFGVLADTIDGARLSSRTPWQALGELGDRIGVPELRDLSGALNLVAEDGAQIRESIAARAAALRQRQLAEVEGNARQADQGMLAAQVGLALAFLLLIIYPAAYQILTF